MRGPHLGHSATWSQKMNSEGVDHSLALKRCLRVVGIAEQPVSEFMRQRHASPARWCISVDDRCPDRIRPNKYLNTAAVWPSFSEPSCEGVKPKCLTQSSEIVDRRRIKAHHLAEPGCNVLRLSVRLRHS